MNFIWDIILNAKERRLEKQDLFFRQAESGSPYYEQSFPAVNQRDVERAVVEINALYRFSHIFEELLHPDLQAALREEGALEFSDYLFDLVVHFLGEIDLKHGLNKREYYVRKLRSELLSGVYGEKAAAAAAVMSRELQFQMANELMTQIQTGTSLLAFRRAMTAAFPQCIIYQSNFDCKALLVYIGEKETKEKVRHLEFILDLFLPFGFSVREFWEYHFGILGVDATMEMNRIALF